MEKGWIFCAGAKRSGSTLQYNIISEILELSGTGVRTEFVPSAEFGLKRNEHTGSGEYKAFKSHSLTDEIQKEIVENNAMAFYAYRDVRDVIVSLQKKQWLTRDIEEIKKATAAYIQNYESWMKIKDFLIIRKYEDFYNDLTAEIKFFLEKVNVQLSEEQIQQIESKLNRESIKENLGKGEMVNLNGNVYDKKTLMHFNHINSGETGQFYNDLTKEEILAIESVASAWLVAHGYELYWKKTPEENFISYSQHADDYIAWQLTGKKKSGVVVEIGAFDGLHLSNSFSLECIGWKSVCVEPNPDVFPMLQRNRARASNVNVAVVADTTVKEITFFSEKLGVLSGCSYDEADIKRRYEKRGLEYESPAEKKVPAKTTNDIFKGLALKAKDIDVISIDVEGFEMEVLNGLDMNVYQPGLFIIEANNEQFKTQIFNFFNKSDLYFYLGNNYQNLFFIRKDLLSKKTLRHLDFQAYIPAKQTHPAGEQYTLSSVKPNFQKSEGFLKYEKYLGIF